MYVKKQTMKFCGNFILIREAPTARDRKKAGRWGKEEWERGLLSLDFGSKL